MSGGAPLDNNTRHSVSNARNGASKVTCAVRRPAKTIRWQPRTQLTSQEFRSRTQRSASKSRTATKTKETAPEWVMPERRRVSHSPLSRPSDPHTTRPAFVDQRLADLNIPELPDVDALCKWISLADINGPSIAALPEWSSDVREYLGKVVYDWAFQEPLIFDLQVSAVLEKRIALTGASHQNDLAAVYSGFFPRFRERLQRKGSNLDALELVAMSALGSYALREGDLDTADLHARALATTFMSIKDVTPSIWLYCVWMELRSAMLNCRRPLIPRWIVAGWPVQDKLTADQILSSCRASSNNVKALGTLPAHLGKALSAAFRYLHYGMAILETHRPTISTQIDIMYHMSWEVTVLHADTANKLPIHVEPSGPTLIQTQAILLELFVISAKLCVVNVTWAIGPQKGTGPVAMLHHAIKFTDSLLPGHMDDGQAQKLCNIGAEFGVGQKAFLWMFLVFTTEARTYVPEDHQYWLQYLRQHAQGLGLRGRVALTKAVASFPCTGKAYARRFVRAWEEMDLTPGWVRWREMRHRIPRVHPTPQQSRSPEVDNYMTSLNFQVQPV